MERQPILLAALVVFCLLAQANGREIINLGFLTPYPLDDSAVPSTLAREWISAIQIAHEILEKRNPSKFAVQPIFKNSNCSREGGANAVKALVNLGVVGIVGPACSEAAIGASQYLATSNSSVPIISFAATASELSNRARYPNFFRTVYPDSEQVKSIMAVSQLFNWTKIYVLYSEDAYGTGFQSDLSSQVVAFNARNTSNRNMELVSLAIPTSLPSSSYGSYISSLSPSQTVPILLALTPQMAENFFFAVYSQGDLGFPWWFMGTDGVTAFDLVGTGTNYRNFAFSLQQEIGVVPYRGDFSVGSPYNQFLALWKNKTYSDYPGLLTFPRYPHFNKTRSYVASLIDAATAFYETFATLYDAGKQVNPETVTASLSNGSFTFRGCSGTVSFKANSGDRSTVSQPPYYELATLQSSTWQSVGAWNESAAEQFSLWTNLIYRPGNSDGTPEPQQSLLLPNGTNFTVLAGPAGSSEAQMSGDLKNPPTNSVIDQLGQTQASTSMAQGTKTAAIVVPVIAAIIACVAVGYVFYVRRQEQKHSEFVRLVF